MSTSQEKGSQIATLEFGHRYVILNTHTGKFLSGKTYHSGPTEPTWHPDPKRARLFKKEWDAQQSNGYAPADCVIYKVSIIRAH